MIRRTHRPKVLGGCLLVVLSVMALSAVSAQALEWKESGAKITVNLGVNGEKDSADWTFDSELGGAAIKILCTVLNVTEGLLKSDGTALAKLEFKTCETFLGNSKTATEECLPKEPITSRVKIHGFLHNNRDYLLFSPDDGSLIFTEISFDKVPGCPVGGGVPIQIKGHMVFEDCENIFRTEVTRHLIQQVKESPVGSLFNSINTPGNENSLKFGTKPLLLLGSEWLKLSTGNSWSGSTL